MSCIKCKQDLLKRRVKMREVAQAEATKSGEIYALYIVESKYFSYNTLEWCIENNVEYVETIEPK